MSSPYLKNCLGFIEAAAADEPRLLPALRALEAFQTADGSIQAGLDDFLSNPFVQTALGILKSFNKTYKVKQAIQLLEEAGREYQEAEDRKARRR